MRKKVLICGILLLAYSGLMAQQQASMREIREGAVQFTSSTSYIHIKTYPTNL